MKLVLFCFSPPMHINVLHCSALMWLMLQCRSVSPQAEAEEKVSLAPLARVISLPSHRGQGEGKALQVWIITWGFGFAALPPEEEKNVLQRSIYSYLFLSLLPSSQSITK